MCFERSATGGRAAARRRNGTGVAVLAVLAFAAGTVEARQPAPVQQQSPQPQAPVPGYVVAEGQHPEAAEPFQSLTVVCPGGLKVFGAGYSAIVRKPGAPANQSGSYVEQGLSQVRSYPDSAGTGWQVQGVFPGASAQQPWRLAVRVVCVRVG